MSPRADEQERRYENIERDPTAGENIWVAEDDGQGEHAKAGGKKATGRQVGLSLDLVSGAGRVAAVRSR